MSQTNPESSQSPTPSESLNSSSSTVTNPVNPQPTPTTTNPNVPSDNATALADGLLTMLTPVVQDCDERIQAVLESQIELATQIDFLTAELEKFMDVSKTPNLVPYVQKLVTCRQRIENINQSLTTINARVERMQKSVVTKQY